MQFASSIFILVLGFPNESVLGVIFDRSIFRKSGKLNMLELGSKKKFSLKLSVYIHVKSKGARAKKSSEIEDHPSPSSSLAASFDL